MQLHRIADLIPNASGCPDVGRAAAERARRERLGPNIFRVTAIDAAGLLHTLRVRAHNHEQVHATVVRLIGGEPTSSSVMYDREATTAARRAALKSFVTHAQTAPRIPRTPQVQRVPQVHLAPDARPSAFGPPTDVDRLCDATDAELQTTERRHTPRARRTALAWQVAIAAAGLLLWAAAAISIWRAAT